MAAIRSPSVCLAAEALAALTAALLAGAREGVEPCGYLLGQRTAGSLQILVVREGRNVHPQPGSAFRLAPDEQLMIRQAAAAQGYALLGVWHGHRRGPAEASEADKRGMESAHPVLARRMPALMLIAAAPGAPGPRLRAYVRTSTAQGGRPAWVAVAVDR